MNTPSALSRRPQILLIEADRTLSGFLRHNLEIEGYEVTAVDPSPDLLARFRESPPDLIIIDWSAADNSAFDLCRRLRMQGETAEAPIIALTSPGPEVESARALVTRNVDRFVKPFSFAAFIARVNALLARAKAASAANLVIGDIELDSSGCRAMRRGREIQLYPAEFRLLEFLMRNAGEVLSRERMVVGAWGRGAAVNVRAIDANVRRIRRAITLDGLADPIRTVHRRGYCFDARPRS